MATDVMKLRQLGLETAETLQGYLHDTQGWQVARKTHEVTIEYKHSAYPGFEHGYLYRGQSHFSCTKEMIFRYIEDQEGGNCVREKWDKDMNSVRVLRQIDDNIRIEVTRTNRAAMGLISPREFIDLVMILKTDHYWSLNSTGVELEEFPPAGGHYVRGFNYPGGFICLPVLGEPGRTKVVTFVQTDIKGMLPLSLVRSAIPGSMISSINGLRDILKKDGHLVS